MAMLTVHTARAGTALEYSAVTLDHPIDRVAQASHPVG
jgi:hypothetical protein